MIADEVVVFLARPEATSRAEADAILAPEDRAHVARFHFERDRELALASRALQRRALSACAPVAPAAWRFVAGATGRPVIDAPRLEQPLAFNVANTRGLVGCAVARDRAIGLDLEPWRDDAPPELIERCFAPAERAGLAALAPADRPRRFVELWVLKEAYLKARGVGLGLPLELVAFALDDGPPRLAVDPSLDDPGGWQLALWSPTPAHAAAVCVQRGDAPALTIHHRWDPA